MEIIKAYKPCCCAKAYIGRSGALRHEKKCPKNPDNRACLTCGSMENLYSVNDDNNAELYCKCKYFNKKLGKVNEMPFQFKCQHWETK